MFAALLGAGGTVFVYLMFPGGVGWIIALFAAAIARYSWEISTWLFSWPLIAGTLCVLIAFERGSQKSVPIIPLLLVGWSALNRDAALGFLLVGLVAVGDLIESRRLVSGESTRDFRRAGFLIGALTISFVLVLFVIPGGGANFPNLISYGVLMNKTGVTQWSSLSLNQHLAFFVFAAVVGFWTGRQGSHDWIGKLALTLALLLTAVSSHFITFFAAVAAYPIARTIDRTYHTPFFSTWKPPSFLSRPVVGVVVVSALILLGTLEDRSRHPYESSVDVLANQEPSGRIFNTPPMGGLIRWKTGRVPFSDLSPGSLSVFDATRPEELLEKMFSTETDLALVNWGFVNRNLSREKPSRSGLRLVYLDDSSLLYAHPEGDSSTEIPMFEHFDPIKKPEDYAPHLVSQVARELNDYLDKFPPSLRVLSILGPLLLREGRDIEALEVYEAASRIAPNDVATLRHLSWLYLESGMYGLAVETTRHAMRFDNGLDLVHNYARSVYGLGRFAEAVPFFERVLAEEDDNIPALRALVDIHQKLDESDISKEYRKRLEILEEKVAGELLANAEKRKRELDFQEAARGYRRAYDVLGEPKHLWAEAIVLLIDSQNEEAARVYEEMIRQRPRFAPAYFMLGMLCVRKVACETDEANQYLETFLELAPEDLNADLARRELAKLQ
jgi:tetratricopeptide (TPR) repeat protein